MELRWLKNVVAATLGGAILWTCFARPAKASVSPPESERLAIASLEEIRSAVNRRDQEIRSLQVEYVVGRLPWDAPLPPHEVYHARTVAVKGQARYVSIAHLRGKDRPENDPGHQMGFFDGRSLKFYYPNDRLVEVYSRRANYFAFTITLRIEPYLECLGWWPVDDDSACPLQSGHCFFLKHVLEYEACRVLPHQELIAGRWCHGVEVPELDTLWIDLERGCLVRRRRVQTDTRTKVEYELSDFRETRSGVWLPHSFQRSEAELREDGKVRVTYGRVTHCQVNEVLDRWFEPELQPGTLIFDCDADQASQVPGGADLLETVCSRVKGMVQAGQTSPRYGLIAWGLAGVGSYLLAKLCWLGVGRIRRPFWGMPKMCRAESVPVDTRQETSSLSS